MAVDLCSTTLTGISAKSSSFPWCSIWEGLGNRRVDIAKLKKVDCIDQTCQFVLKSIADYQATLASTGISCTVTDTSTGSLINITVLGSVCDGIAVTKTAIPSNFQNITTYTPSPISFLTPAPTFLSTAPTPAIPSTTTTPSSSGEETKSSNSTGIVIGVSVAAIALIAAILFVIWRRRRAAAAGQALPSNQPYGRLNSPQPNSQKPSSGAGTTSSSHKDGNAFELDKLDLDMHRVTWNEVHLVKMLAQGAYGEVWLGEYLDGKIAVKRLLPTKTTKQDLQKFIYEIHLVSKIDCPYVVQFLGVTWSKLSDMMLLAEFMDGGDLRQVLEANNTKRSFTWTHKIHCALNIAEALVFLHSMDPIVIHRDLKSRNVLLDADFNAKITDFGIAREVDETTLTAGIGTYRWIAPEVLVYGHYSESADMFSFGVILSELDTEIEPYSDLRNGAGKPYQDTALLAKVMAGELLPCFSPDCETWFVHLARDCLALDPLDPLDRPTAM
ncbi:unnamed protein product [Aphanomyces euteiches]